jgi:hypothetical protein
MDQWSQPSRDFSILQRPLNLCHRHQFCIWMNWHILDTIQRCNSPSSKVQFLDFIFGGGTNLLPIPVLSYTNPVNTHQFSSISFSHWENTNQKLMPFKLAVRVTDWKRSG